MVSRNFAFTAPVPGSLTHSAKATLALWPTTQEEAHARNSQNS